MSGSYTTTFMYVGDYIPIKWAYHMSGHKIENHLSSHKAEILIIHFAQNSSFLFYKTLTAIDIFITTQSCVAPTKVSHVLLPTQKIPL